jgi:hypothetical protein
LESTRTRHGPVTGGTCESLLEPGWVTPVGTAASAKVEIDDLSDLCEPRHHGFEREWFVPGPPGTRTTVGHRTISGPDGLSAAPSTSKKSRTSPALMHDDDTRVDMHRHERSA